MQLNIIFGPLDAPNNDASFSTAAKLEEVITMFISMGSNVRHIYIKFMQSESLTDSNFEHDVSKFPALAQMLVQEALVATRETIQKRRIDLTMKSNGDILVEKMERIVSQD